MGTFKVAKDTAFRMDTLNFDDIPHGHATYTPTLIHVVYDDGGYTDLTGNFSFSGGQVYGTLTGLEDVDANGADNYKITGVSADAHQLSIDFYTSNEADALQLLFAGKDKMSGSSFDDYLEGFASNDRIDGGKGNDTLVGGDGKDVFEFSGKSGADTIADFAKGDKISIDAKGVDDFSDLRIGDDGNGGAFVAWKGGSVDVAGVAPGALKSGDFSFGSAAGHIEAAVATHHLAMPDAMLSHHLAIS